MVHVPQAFIGNCIDGEGCGLDNGDLQVRNCYLLYCYPYYIVFEYCRILIYGMVAAATLACYRACPCSLTHMPRFVLVRCHVSYMSAGRWLCRCCHVPLHSRTRATTRAAATTSTPTRCGSSTRQVGKAKAHWGWHS
eukprot:COSAG06_NODE_2642_length_6517_cov_33.378778_7_plen_137_part_00